MVKILFKTPSKEHPFELNVDPAVVSNIEKLKVEVSGQTGAPVANIKLIHKGIASVTQGKYSRTTSLSSRSSSTMGRLSTLSSNPANRLSQKPLLQLPHPRPGPVGLLETQEALQD